MSEGGDSSNSGSGGVPLPGMGFDPPPAAPPHPQDYQRGMAAYGGGMIPPPPPPMNWEPPKPTSGMAIASLVCGIAGVLLGFACFVPFLAIPVGLVLGFLAIGQTGRNGTRSGRGLAIAGTAVNGLALAGAVVAIVGFGLLIERESRNQHQRESRQVEQDFNLARERLLEYYNANGRSLGPGGPRLAKGWDSAPVAAGTTRPSVVAPGREDGTVPTNEGASTVTAALKFEDLVHEDELSERYSGSYTLEITGKRGAVLKHSSGRFMEIFDIESPSGYAFHDTEE